MRKFPPSPTREDLTEKLKQSADYVKNLSSVDRALLFVRQGQSFAKYSVGDYIGVAIVEANPSVVLADEVERLQKLIEDIDNILKANSSLEFTTNFCVHKELLPEFKINACLNKIKDSKNAS